MKAPLPSNEINRLEALRHYDVLDTPPEQAFDDLVHLAAEICGTQISAITLVDDDRQWFKARLGIKESQTSRDISFCAHTILEEQILVVPDVSVDARFADNPLVNYEPHVRFYAGVPLITPEGQAVGALCVLDTVPRQLKQVQQDALCRLARQAVALLEAKPIVGDGKSRKARQQLQQEQRSKLLEIAKRDTERLKASETRYRRLFEAAQDGILILDAETGKIKDVNPFLCHLLEYSADDLIGMQLWEIGSFHDIAASQAAFQALQEKGYISYNDLPLQTKAGKSICVEFVSNIYQSGDEKVIQCNIRDITDRKQSEESLHQSEANLRAAQQVAHLGSWELDLADSDDLNRNSLRWSDEIFHIFGYEPGQIEVSNDNFFHAVHPDDRESVRIAMARALKNGERYSIDHRIILPNGVERFVHEQADIIRDHSSGAPLRMVGIVQDVTERKIIEEDSTRLAAIVEHSDDAIVSKTLDGIITSWNTGAQTLYGYTAEEAIGRSISMVAPPDQPDIIPQLLEQIRQGKPVKHYETERICKDGSRVCISLSISPLKDASGRIIGASAIKRDITQQKIVEQQLKMHSHLLNVIGQAIIVADLEGIITYWNASAAELYGWSVNEALGQNILVVRPTDITDEQAAEIHACLTSGKPWSGECIAGRRDGTTFPAYIIDTPVFDAAGQVTSIISLSLDISERKQIEDALVESQHFLQSTLDALSSHIAVLDKDGVIIAVNKAWLHYSEENGGDIFRCGVGTNYLEVCNSPTSAQVDEAPAVAQGIDEIMSGRQQIFSMEYPCHGDNEKRWFNVRITRFPEDGPLCIVVAHEDITARRLAEEALQKEHEELEMRVARRTAELKRVNVALLEKETEQQRVMATLIQSEERFRVMVENVHDYAILMLDATGHVMTWNVGAERMKGYRSEEIIGQHFSCFYTEEARQAGVPEQEIQIAQTKGFIDGEGWRVRNDGSRFWATLVLTALHDDKGQLRGFAKITHDITERKNVEAALHEAIAQADAANTAKSEFLSRMSHELRTPLNAILGFGQILERQELSPRSKESIGYILKGGRHLLDLINEVLDIARVEAGHLELSLEPVALDEVVPEVCALVQPLAAERHIHLRKNTVGLSKCYVLADLQRLKQVLINLLSNAIKYNREGGQVEVTFEPQTDGMVSIVVRDTGPGISSENLPKLFFPFERLGASTSSIEGTGLGLVLSQRLVIAMAGTLSVQSTLGEGTTFTIKLPQIAAPEGQLTNVPAHINQLLRGNPTERIHSVLCIEDNLSNLRLMETIFESRPSIKLLAAMQGSVGLDLARQHDPDLILLDLDLPDIHGSEVLSRLQKLANTRDIPVVIVSADATSTQMERLLAAGAKAYLTKPLDVGHFLDTVDKFVTHKVTNQNKQINEDVI